LNEPLRRALVHARLREEDVATSLGVDPKTVRRWLSGRVPYPRYRAAIANLVDVDEADLWPDAGGPLAARIRPSELRSVYPHRRAIPREVWVRFFGSVQREIGILAYSALPLAEDEGILHLLAAKAALGVRVRIALGDPWSRQVAVQGEEEVIGEAMRAKIRKAITLYQPLTETGNVEIRLHEAVLYNSIYCADDELLVNQHVYGVPASHSPVFSLKKAEAGAMVDVYLGSFDRVWAAAIPLPSPLWSARRADTARGGRSGDLPR
jgi:transcriptional regulator with XRE-family HTH domain